MTDAHSHSHSHTHDGDTPMEVIAQVARVVSMSIDRITGDRSDVPLLVAAAVVEALKNHGIEARIMYGAAAWVEILDDNTPIWSGCWGQSLHFWAATQFGEIVDLNTSVSHRKRPHDQPELKPAYSPPMVWTKELPRFYRYQAEGAAEIELSDPKDIDRWNKVSREISEKCTPGILEEAAKEGKDPQFPNEPILCPGRKLLDDSNQSFRHFDRALAVHGIPQSPF